MLYYGLRNKTKQDNIVWPWPKSDLAAHWFSQFSRCLVPTSQTTSGSCLCSVHTMTIFDLGLSLCNLTIVYPPGSRSETVLIAYHLVVE